jgi:diguanylate cyclase (GGDEF)-like protein
MDNDVEDGWNIFVDVGIKSESGELLGVGGIAWEMSNLQELVKNYEDKYNMEIFFADETGKVIIKNGSMEEYEKDFSLPAEADKEKIVVSKTGIKSNYMVTQYIESLECYMIIRDLDPYDYTFKHILIILNIATFITFVLITLICLYHVVKRNKILFRSSYVDELTGMLNRRAFEDKIGKIRKKGHPENIKVAAFDVNGLKVSNDTLGHTAGDELISGAADVIRETFDSYGKCYRTGGDEFVAVLDKSVEDTDELAERFEKAVSEWHGTQVEKMSVSYGIISSDDDENISIDDMLVSADEEMYRNKRKYYSVNENNRRKA